MSKQPTAIYLAEQAEKGDAEKYSISIAAKLRRLHEVNAELLETLKNLLNAKNGECAVFNSDDIARAAIAKAEGDQA